MQQAEPRGVIYCIQNEITGAVYIGQTKNLARSRWHGHLCDLRKGRHGNRYLQSAWNKYGEAAFTFTALESGLSGEALDEAEAFYVEYLRAIGAALMNLRRGGGAQARRLVPAKPFTPEHRQRMSERAKEMGKTFPPGAREKARLLSIGRQKSESEKAKWREKNVGRKWTKEQRERLSARLKGHKKTITQRLRDSRHRMMGPQSPELVAKRIGAQVANYPVRIFRAPDATEHRTQNVRAFAREHNLHPRLLGYVAEGKQRHHQGWTLIKVCVKGDP